MEPKKDAEIAATPALNLANELVRALGEAAQNAVVAQQQLWVLGQAALTQALARREAGGADAPGTAATTGTSAAAKDLEPLRERLQATKRAARGAAAGPEPETRGDLPDELLELMTSFSLSMTLLDEVWTQQALDIVQVVIAADLELGQKELDPASARLFVELLSGNRVVQVLADLDAVEGALAQLETSGR